jgi:rhodanese-related sulfurtransferase
MTRFDRLMLVTLPVLLAVGCSDRAGDEASPDAGAEAAAQPAAVTEGTSAAAVISPADLVVRLNTDRAPVLLDVRSAEEFAAGHIPGAIHIPYDEIPSRLAELAEYRDAELVVYCRTGRRAGIAEATLREAGFSSVSDLDGHMREWTAARHPVTDPQPCC